MCVVVWLLVLHPRSFLIHCCPDPPKADQNRSTFDFIFLVLGQRFTPGRMGHNP